MTVKELIDQLNRVPEGATIIFSPKDLCSSGWPEWAECHLTNEFEYQMVNGKEEEVPTGRLMIELRDEIV